MRRELLLLDVTEMSGSNVCVAGIEPTTCTQFRLADPTPTQAVLRRLGGLQPGDVIEVDIDPLRRPVAPHVEDARWNPTTVQRLRTLTNDQIHATVSRCSFRSVVAAFGEPSRRAIGRNSAWPPNGGERSLATLRVRYVRFDLDKNDHVRVAFKDADDGYYQSVPFQDLRLKTHQCDGCDTNLLHVVKREFEMNAGLVRIGLTRPFAPDKGEAACWLQVTNIFARDRQHFV